MSKISFFNSSKMALAIILRGTSPIFIGLIPGHCVKWNQSTSDEGTLMVWIYIISASSSDSCKGSANVFGCRFE